MTTEKGGRQAALFIALMVCLAIPPPRTCEQLARTGRLYRISRADVRRWPGRRFRYRSLAWFAGMAAGGDQASGPALTETLRGAQLHARSIMTGRGGRPDPGQLGQHNECVLSGLLSSGRGQ